MSANFVNWKNVFTEKNNSIEIMKTWISQILNSKERTALLIMTHPGIEIIGKTVKDAVTDGEIHYEAIKAVSDTYHTSACTVIMDLTVEAEAFGAQITIPDNEVPSVTGRLVNGPESVEALQIPDLTAGRIPEYLLANRLAAENIKDKPVFAGCIGPYSLAGRLYEMSEIMVAIYIDSETVLNLLSKCTQFLINYCKALKATGANGVILAEPAAGLLSNEDCLTYSTVFVKKIVEEVQDDDFTIILHNCGNTGHCTDAMIASGAHALHFGNKIDMVQVLKDCPSGLIVMGNIDPVSVFKQGDENMVTSITCDLLEKTESFNNFVISSGCDIPPHIPEKNIQAFFESVKNYNLREVKGSS